ncbi:bi-functional transferase/deacetylase [Kocuria polaris]|nr:bi-functional transferase/deacetylase [Kocuria polaris]
MLSVVALALVLALAVQGYVHQLTATNDDELGPLPTAVTVPDSVLDGGPLVDARDQPPSTSGPAAGTVALTLDGPLNRREVPALLDVLAEHEVEATFFVVGMDGIDDAHLVRQIADRGHEIGISALTTTDLAAAPGWQRWLELRGATNAVVDATGSVPHFFRPPFSSGNDAVSDGSWAAMRSAADQGFITVLSTTQGEEWTVGADATEETESSYDGGEVLQFAMGSAAPADSAAQLDTLLTKVVSEGEKIGAVGQSLGVEATTPASVIDRARGAAMVWAIRISDLAVPAIAWGLVAAGVLTLIRAFLVMGFAMRHHRAARDLVDARYGRYRMDVRVPPEVNSPATVVVPAYNEAAGIEAAVRSIAASTHEVEIIVVDDGSTDDTAGIAERLQLPNVVVFRKENGGKPSALNAGIAAASHEIVVMVDGDTVFEPDTVHALVQQFADPKVGAISGNTKVANRDGLLGSWQHIEYVVGFNLDRRLFDVAECMPTVPGAIGAFRREAITRTGGVSSDTLAEDTDLTMSLCRDGWRVVYEDSALAWTEAPASLGALWKQRYRWCYGTLQAMWKHRGAVRQAGAAGKLGRRGLAYLFILQVLLPLFAPVVDLFAIYGLFFLDPVRIAGLWLGFLLVQLLMAAYAFRIDREPLRALWTLPLQQVVYRQLMYLVVIQSVVTALAGVHLRWHRMERYGSLRAPRSAPGG